MMTGTDDELEPEINSPDFQSQVSKDSVALHYTLWTLILGGFDRKKFIRKFIRRSITIYSMQGHLKERALIGFGGGN